MLSRGEALNESENNVIDNSETLQTVENKLSKNYFNNVSAKAINEISQIINHRNAATKKYYITFCVESNFLVPSIIFKNKNWLKVQCLCRFSINNIKKQRPM